MRRSATPKQRRRPVTKTLFRCGHFELRVMKIRRQRVTPSVSCGRFNLRCTKIREEMIHLGTPPFTEDALKTKQKAAHTPDSSSFAENDVEAHARAKVFRKKGLDHIDLLDVLFANSQATGALARASTQGPPTSDEERDIQSAFFGVGINSNTDSIPIDDDMDRDDDPKVGGNCDPKVGKRVHTLISHLIHGLPQTFPKKNFLLAKTKWLKRARLRKNKTPLQHVSNVWQQWMKSLPTNT